MIPKRVSVFSIPKITDERLLELSARLKPAVEFRGDWRLIKMHGANDAHQLRCISFIWEPKYSDAVILEKVGEIQTLHSFGFPGVFKPSIAEVLAQLPEEYVGKADAFTIQGPRNAKDLDDNAEALKHGFHVAIVTLHRILKTIKISPRRQLVSDIEDGAAGHAEDTDEPDHEVGDLQEVLHAAVDLIPDNKLEKFRNLEIVKRVINRGIDPE